MLSYRNSGTQRSLSHGVNPKTRMRRLSREVERSAPTTPAIMSYNPPATDPLGWRLVISEDSHGQQKWQYLPPGAQRDEIPQDQVTKYALGLEVGAKKQKKAKNPGEAARNGYEFYKLLQSSDGHFATEYGGEFSLSFDSVSQVGGVVEGEKGD
jgi:hypothetical protein